jgi:hypothetical protein
MNKMVAITLSPLILIGGAVFASAQKTTKTQVTVKQTSVEFKGLTRQDIDEVRRTLNAAVSRTVSGFTAGEVAKTKKDCKRIDLTNKQVCVEITIEDID